MQEEKEPEYKSFWELMEDWGHQGWFGYTKLAIYVIFMFFFFIPFLTYILSPLLFEPNGFGYIPGTLLLVGTLVAVQVAGNKIKIKVKK